MKREAGEMVEVFNVNKPGTSSMVRKALYEEMRRALLELLPPTAPGLSQAEMVEGIPRLLSQELFPGGDKASWWLKAVQLDLEARRLVLRVPGKPSTWYRGSPSAEIRPVAGAKRRIVRRPRREPPAYLRDRLEREGLVEAFAGRPPYQRNDYVGWILAAKREATREKRLALMLEELRAGDRYMNMAYKGNPGAPEEVEG